MTSTTPDSDRPGLAAEPPDWTVDGGRLVRTVRARSFPAAIDLVVAVAAVAEELGHHPDIDIRYSAVTFVCTTHNSGSVITDLDRALAGRIDTLAAAR